MIKRQFLKMVKLRMLSFKMSKDIADQIVSELDVKFEMGRARGKKDSEIISEMGGVSEIATNYAKKFGYMKKEYSTPDIESDRKIKLPKNTGKNIIQLEKIKNAIPKPQHTTKENDEGRGYGDGNTVQTQRVKNKKAEKKRNDNKEKNPVLNAIAIIFAIMSITGVGSSILNTISDGGGNLFDGGPSKIEYIEDEYSKVKINSMNLDVNITRSDKEYTGEKGIVLKGVDGEDISDEIEYKVVDNTLIIDVKQEYTPTVNAIEVLLDEPKNYDIEMNSIGGVVEINDDLKSLNLKSKESTVNIYCEQGYNIAVENELGYTSVECTDADLDVIASSLNGIVNVDYGEYYAGEEIPKDYNGTSMYGQFKDSKYRVRLNSTEGNIDFYAE